MGALAKCPAKIRPPRFLALNFNYRKEMIMTNTKPALASSAVWGSIIAGISAACLIAGIKIDGIDNPELPLQISGAVGAVLSLVGRLRATAEINGWIK